MSTNNAVDKLENKHDPLVSIIMNCFNGEAYLAESIASVLGQSYRNWELIFWDNASQDGTAKIATSFNDPRIRYFCSEETVPLGQARNLAIEKVQGDYVCFLDSDDIWLPQKLTLQIDWFHKNPGYGFLYSNYYKLLQNAKVKRVACRDAQPQGHVFGAFLSQYPVNLQTVMIRSEALKALDRLFDPEKEMAEEYDLFMRLVYRERAGYIAEPLVEYRVHDNMTSIRKIGKYPQEFAAVLRELEAQVPDFRIRYKHDVDQAYAKLGYYRARASMAEGKKQQATIDLKPYASSGLKFRILYCLTFLGVPVWVRVHKMLGRFS